MLVCASLSASFQECDVSSLLLVSSGSWLWQRNADLPTSQKIWESLLLAALNILLPSADIYLNLYLFVNNPFKG